MLTFAFLIIYIITRFNENFILLAERISED
jgi:hypothetical protein